MGSCRKGYNLLTKIGSKHLKEDFKRGGWRYYWFNDTFGRYFCMIFGHIDTFETDDYPPKILCKRCLKEIKLLSH